VSKKSLLAGLAGVVALFACASTASAASGGGCQLQGTANISPGLNANAQAFTYNFGGNLTGCQSSEAGAPATGTVSAGQALLAPAITRRLIEDFCNGPAPGAAAAGETGRLSERELDVVRLVARGMSNAEIAAKLYLSEATIKSHIARVLAKLGLRDRVQVAVFAYEKGIVRPGRSLA